MVPGVFIGLLLGFVAELFFGFSVLWMMAGGLVGLLCGGVADLIRHYRRR